MSRVGYLPASLGKNVILALFTAVAAASAAVSATFLYCGTRRTSPPAPARCRTESRKGRRRAPAPLGRPAAPAAPRGTSSAAPDRCDPAARCTHARTEDCDLVGEWTAQWAAPPQPDRRAASARPAASVAWP
eukprot:scaffold343_cov245-Pinguiococcus_pyrenoidosus.AAC.27